MNDDDFCPRKRDYNWQGKLLSKRNKDWIIEKDNNRSECDSTILVIYSQTGPRVNPKFDELKISIF